MAYPKDVLQSKFGNLDRSEWSYEQCKLTYFERLKTGVTAPSQFVFSPSKEMNKETLSIKFTTALDKILEAIDNWSETDLSTYTLPHPAIGLISIREMLFSTDFHTIHHYGQLNTAIS